MTLKLLVIAAALLTMSACEVRSSGDGPAYSSAGSPRERDFNNFSTDDRGRQEALEGHKYWD
jgi:hypothetical protein